MTSMTNGKRKGREGSWTEARERRMKALRAAFVKKEGNGRLKGGEAGVGEIGRFTVVSTP